MYYYFLEYINNIILISANIERNNHENNFFLFKLAKQALSAGPVREGDMGRIRICPLRR